jgi:hypothetical protein
MKSIISFLLFINAAFAADAVVRVLKAPLFESKNTKSKVVQWVDKGETVFIHPSAIRTDNPYESFKDTEDLEEIVLEVNEKYPDQYLDKDMYIHDQEDEFLLTMDSQGRKAYILKKHVFIYYKDPRESEQKKLAHDDTDYRLVEPLKKNYPYKSKTGFKGSFSFGIGTQSKTSYPYTERITSQNYQNKFEFNAIWSRKVSWDETDRFYFGAILTGTHHENKLRLQTRKASERWVKAGIGPYFSYDAWKTRNNAITLFCNLLINLININYVSQEDFSGNFDKKIFRQYSITPRVGALLQKKNFIPEMDLFTGVTVQFEAPYEMGTKRRAEQASWWRKQTDETYSVNPSAEFSFIFGVQSAY